MKGKKASVYLCFVGFILSLIGTSAISTAMGAKDQWDVMKANVSAEVVFVNPDNPKDVVVEFELNGESYTPSLPQVDRVYEEGETVWVETNPGNPDMLWINQSVKVWMGAALFIVGITLFTLALFSLQKEPRQEKFVSNYNVAEKDRRVK